MAIPRQIGWSVEANLLHRILQQLEAINKSLGSGASPTSTNNSTTTITTTV